LALVTSCGNDVASTWAALLRGESGIDLIKKFDPEKVFGQNRGPKSNFDPTRFSR
jgi:3-oxoacyl-(acyl-carrier-protein) synthase